MFIQNNSFIVVVSLESNNNHWYLHWTRAYMNICSTLSRRFSVQCVINTRMSTRTSQMNPCTEWTDRIEFFGELRRWNAFFFWKPKANERIFWLSNHHLLWSLIVFSECTKTVAVCWKRFDRTMYSPVWWNVCKCWTLWMNFVIFRLISAFYSNKKKVYWELNIRFHVYFINFFVIINRSDIDSIILIRIC